jgi:DNA-binding response OmpR family regulator
MNTMTARKRVVVAEDDPNILISLDFLLTNAAYAVHTASDGGKAWEIIERTKPDLVVLDIMLPALDGYELCRLIRATATLDRTRIVILSAHGHEAEINKGLRLGADAYLRKPFGTRDFLDTIAHLLAEPRQQNPQPGT